MDERIKRLLGILILTLAYPATAYVVRYIPNPVVPGALLALNMIFPVLAGYFYGPCSGALAGCLGTALSALLQVDMYDALAIFPHTAMGLTAGLAGNRRADFLGALTVLVGHGLNLLFYWRLGQMEINPETVSITLLGLTSETMVDIVAILLLIVWLKHWLYQVRYRW